MSNVFLPIETTREGNKITKVCVEDIYKMLNRICDPLQKTVDLTDEAFKEIKDANGDDVEGHFIIGTGVSQPSIGDAFDEEIGNNIAFMKAKLNANLKKRNLIGRIWKQLYETFVVTEEELDHLDALIQMDINGVRNYNPEYMSDYTPFFSDEKELNENE